MHSNTVSQPEHVLSQPLPSSPFPFHRSDRQQIDFLQPPRGLTSVTACSTSSQDLLIFLPFKLTKSPWEWMCCIVYFWSKNILLSLQNAPLVSTILLYSLLGGTCSLEVLKLPITKVTLLCQATSKGFFSWRRSIEKTDWDIQNSQLTLSSSSLQPIKELRKSTLDYL